MRLSFVMRLVLVVLAVFALMIGFQVLAPVMEPWRDLLMNETVRRIVATPYFTIGDLAVTPGFVIKAVLFLLLLGLFSGWIRRFLRDKLLVYTSLDQGQRYAVARICGYGVFLLGLLIGVQSAGANLNSLLLVGGAVGIGIGLGLQNIANNFISGIILLVERPVKIGDRVEVEGIYGDVVRIVARSTWVRTNDNVVIIIPNSQFTENRVINWTANDRLVRFTVPFGVSYGSDPEQVRDVVLALARENPNVLSSPPPDIIFTGFGDSALNFELRVWTETRVQNPKVLASDLYFAMFRAFRERGIEIPFPQRDLHLKSVIPLPVKSEG